MTGAPQQTDRVVMKIQAEYKYSGVYDLFCDAIYQYKLASLATKNYHKNRHSRASIISSALIIESCANCLIKTLDISLKLKDELDKLPVIAKFETFLRLNGKSTFDRGNNKVEKIVELIKLRNEFVHPKVTNIKTEIGQPSNDDGQYYSIPMELTGEEWKALGIPKKGLFWFEDNSLTVLKAVTEFVTYYFFELLELTKQDIQKMLISRVEFADVVSPMLFEDFETEIMDAMEFGLDLSFLVNNQR